MTAEERIASLEVQLSQVLDQLRLTQEELRQAHEQLAVTNKRIEELEKQKTPPPAFVKANVKKPQEGKRSRARSVTLGIIAPGVGKSRRGSSSTGSAHARAVVADWEG